MIRFSAIWALFCSSLFFFFWALFSSYVSAAAANDLPGVYTFGGGTDACSQHTPYCESRISCSGTKGGKAKNEVLVLNHTLSSPGAKLGVMDHFWHVGPSGLELAQNGLQIEIRYYVDGETVPSIVFDPPMATGQGFATVEQDGGIVDATALVGNDGLWNAGSKMGKSGLVASDWHHHPITFERNIRVTQSVRCLNETRCANPSAPTPANGYPGLGCVASTAIVQGHEQSTPLTLRSGFTLPLNARMQLLKIEGKDFAPHEFVPLANVSAGHVALLYLVAMSLQASPPWAQCENANCSRWKGGINNYVEGCWSLLRSQDEELPGMIVGTGLEGGPLHNNKKDQFIDPECLDTSYAFGLLNRSLTGLNVNCKDSVCTRQGKLWQTANTGALHFSADYSAAAKRKYPGSNVSGSKGGVERISAYRFFDEQVMGGNDGMTYGWRNGAYSSGTGVPGAYGGKCSYSGRPPGRNVGITTVTSYAWVFTWPRSGEAAVKTDDAAASTTTTATIAGHSARPISQWSADDVISWAKENKLKFNFEVLAEADVDGDVLQEVNDAVLEKDLKVTNGIHRIKIIKAIKKGVSAEPSFGSGSSSSAKVSSGYGSSSKPPPVSSSTTSGSKGAL